MRHKKHPTQREANPRPTTLFQPGIPVRIDKKGTFFMMPRGKYTGSVSGLKDGLGNVTITDDTGEFIFVRVRQAPLGGRHLIGKIVYFAKWRLVRLPTKRRGPVYG